MNIEKHREQIIKKFKEIKHNEGLILIEHVINNKYDEDLLENIVISLSKIRINIYMKFMIILLKIQK